MVEGIHKLLPSHVLKYDLDGGTCDVEQYWHLPHLDVGTVTGDLDEHVVRLDALMGRAVRAQLAADVPVGVLLSGGLDSSLITAFAAECSSDLKTYTITFPGHDAFDEAVHARIVARHFATDHHELLADDLGPDLLMEIAYGLDDPIADSSVIPTYVVSRLVRGECTVALGGDGGDELFGGYVQYQHLRKLEKLASLVPRGAMEAASWIGSYVVPNGARGAYWANALGQDLSVPNAQLPLIFSARQASRVFPHLRRSGLSGGIVGRAASGADFDLVQEAMRGDALGYLPNDILAKVDRMSMLNSLEVRAPFLDRSLVEFAFRTLGAGQYVSASVRKEPLRRLAAKRLPKDLNVNRKQGFSIPLASWIKANAAWRTTFEELLLGEPECFHDRTEARSLLVSARKGRDTSSQIMALSVLELWRRSFNIQLPGSSD
jgi:asparagine synthase (glutamine-hydrolysing)